MIANLNRKFYFGYLNYQKKDFQTALLTGTLFIDINNSILNNYPECIVYLTLYPFFNK